MTIRAATVRDVAKLARTSVASVSRYLNSKDVMSDDLRARIIHAIDETGYVLNPTARSLSTAVAGSIGLLSLLSEPDKHATLLLCIIREINVRGLKAIVHIEDQDDGSTVDHVKALRGSVDRLIVLADADTGSGWVRHWEGLTAVIAYLLPPLGYDDVPRRAASIVRFAVDVSAGDGLLSMI